MILPVLLSMFPAAAVVLAQEDSTAQPVCSVNQLFNGQICTCAPGYFSSANDESKTRCEDECEEVYFSFFTYGKCVGDIFGKLPKDQQPACNLRCGVRPRLWTSIGIFCVFAAALATLLFTIPMCIATCASCLHAKKANKNAKRVIMEQQAQPSKDQQVATMGYNPYAYWPYYGRA
ncbi:hypothetical protein RB195_006359 [Necator americanus]|uniref:Uncharacterized protein n=2 Tax=Necator americanus TaxID=51031 RepID=A0ABR1BSA2_NECAM|nr:hypothetical protein NECAME_00192 [Necator americanus]ETN81842.1 hypothetical protein NECAME_00192 [Necator americanus]